MTELEAVSGHGRYGSPSPDWSSTEITILRQGVAEQKTAREIAALLPGRSRNSILGKIHRLGITGTWGGRKKAMREQRHQRRSELKRVRKRVAIMAAGVSFESAPPPREDNWIPPLESRRSLVELTNDTCRWPYGRPGTDGFFFCGEWPALGKVYCAHHARIAFRPPGRER